MSRSNVVQMVDSSEKSKEEFNALKTSLNYLDLNWAFQTQTIISYLGLPLGDALIQPKTGVLSNSIAFKFGHKTIESFICSAEKSLGLNWNWEKWVNYVTAFRYKSFFNIHSESPIETIKQYDDVKMVLGRDPVNTEEYYSARDTFLLKQKEDMVLQHHVEVQNLSKKINSLESQEKTLHNILSSKTEELMQAKNNFNSELVLLKTDHEKDVENITLRNVDALIKQEQNLTATFNKQINDLTEEKQKTIDLLMKDLFDIEKKSLIKIDNIQKDSELKISLLNKNSQDEINQIKNDADKQVEMIKRKCQEDIKQIKEKYNESNFVSINEYNKIKQQLNNEVTQFREVLIKLGESEKKLVNSEIKSEQNQVKIDLLQKHMAEQEEIVQVMQRHMSYDSSSTANINDIMILEKEIESLKYYCERFKNTSCKWKNKYKDLTLKLESMSIKVSDLKKNNDCFSKIELENKIKNEITINKKVKNKALTIKSILLYSSIAISGMFLLAMNFYF